MCDCDCGYDCGYMEYQLEEKDSLLERRNILLKACYDLLQKQNHSQRGVLNLLEETVYYDETDCDGYCLMEDIKMELGLED